MKFAAYWQGEDGIRNVIPNRNGARFPEGFGVLDQIAAICRWTGVVVEVGCGYGRLAPAFRQDQYIGVDCNTDAIVRAKCENPGYDFRVVDRYEYPDSVAKLAYTVALHIPDDEFPEFIAALCSSTDHQVLVCEILGGHLRRELEHKDGIGWIQPTFGRSEETFEKEFFKNDFMLLRKHVFKYPTKGHISFLDFRRIDDSR